MKKTFFKKTSVFVRRILESLESGIRMKKRFLRNHPYLDCLSATAPFLENLSFYRDISNISI